MCARTRKAPEALAHPWNLVLPSVVSAAILRTCVACLPPPSVAHGRMWSLSTRG